MLEWREQYFTELKESDDPLLDDIGDLSDAFRAVLNEIFNRFDVDRDGLLVEKELQNFARACNGKDFPPEEVAEVWQFFACGKNLAGDRGLQLEGFLDLYLTQTGARSLDSHNYGSNEIVSTVNYLCMPRPEDTWSDLFALGYDKTLSLKSISTETSAAKPLVP